MKTYFKESFLCLLLLSFSNLYSQVDPGGVSGHDIWYQKNDAQDVIGNYKTFDLLNFESQNKLEELSSYSSLTAFFVLKVKGQPVGAKFIDFGEFHLFDNRIEFQDYSKTINYDSEEGDIIAIQAQLPKRYSVKTDWRVLIGDTSVFSMAEFIAFPRILDREELRKVSSYLALKYSITITENQDAKWRDYITSKNAHYWDSGIDKYYKNRVIGIGRSDKDSLYQTQTISNKDLDLKISLGYEVEEGKMPNKIMGDESFIIFSERNLKNMKPTSCLMSNPNKNPLRAWKFKLKNWSSIETDLKLEVEIENALDVSDSIFIYDGNNYRYLALSSNDSTKAYYTVKLDSLQNGVNYYFTLSKQKSNCTDLDIQVQGNDVVISNSIDENWQAEYHSLETGLSIVDQVDVRNTSRRLENGQYLITIKDSEGVSQKSEVVMITSQGGNGVELNNGPELTVYPNPMKRGEVSHLSIKNIPNKGDLNLTIVDANGREVISKNLAYQNEILESIKISIPGTYTIIATQSNTIYTLKLVVIDSL